MPSCKEAVRKTLDLIGDGRLVEIRGLGVPQGQRRGTASGYFTDYDRAALAAEKLDAQRPHGVYFVYNELHPGCLARSPNQINWSGDRGNATANRDVIRIRWGLVDIDPVRPSGISSTDGEMGRAVEVRDLLGAQLELVWPARIVYALSGNGAHLLLELLEAADESDLKDLLDTATTWLGEDPLVNIDTSVSSPAQLTRLYGTHARKGFATADRPHRQSVIERVFSPEGRSNGTPKEARLPVAGSESSGPYF